MDFEKTKGKVDPDNHLSVKCDGRESGVLLTSGLGVQAGLIHEDGSECEDTEICLAREQCPEVNTLYTKLSRLDEKSSRAKSIQQSLKQKVGQLKFLLVI